MVFQKNIIKITCFHSHNLLRLRLVIGLVFFLALLLKPLIRFLIPFQFEMLMFLSLVFLPCFSLLIYLL